MSSDADRLAALEATVAELRAEVARLRATTLHSMHLTHRCPACGTSALLHFRKVVHLGVPVALQKKRRTMLGFEIVAGNVQAYACPTCGLVELRASELEEAELDEVVEAVAAPAEPEPPAEGPYR